MNDTLISLLIGIGIGVGLVFIYIAYRIKTVMNALDRAINEAIEQVADRLVRIVVEKDNGTYYCYRKENHQFVCQAPNVKDLIEIFRSQFPNKHPVIAEGTSEDIINEFKALIADEDSVSK